MARTNYGEGSYRFGYQGQFAEEDTETGFNAFELRLYDPVVGRWNATDPYGQHTSPYLSMGNNPVSRTDPNGGFDTKFGAWLWSKFHGGGEIYKNSYGGYKVVQMGEDGMPVINAGKIGSDGTGSFFDVLGDLLQDDLGVAIIGSGADNISFHNQSSKRVITVKLDDFLTALSPIVQSFGSSQVSVDNFKRTVSNPNVYDRAKKLGDYVNAILEASKEFKKAKKEHDSKHGIYSIGTPNFYDSSFIDQNGVYRHILDSSTLSPKDRNRLRNDGLFIKHPNLKHK